MLRSSGPNEVSIRDVSAINPLMGTAGWPKGPSKSLDRLMQVEIAPYTLLRLFGTYSGSSTCPRINYDSEPNRTST